MDERIQQIKKEFMCSSALAHATLHALADKANTGFGSLSLLRGIMRQPDCNASRILIQHGLELERLVEACRAQVVDKTPSAYSLLARAHFCVGRVATTDDVLRLILDDDRTSGSKLLNSVGLDRASLDILAGSPDNEGEARGVGAPQEKASEAPSADEESQDWSLAYEESGWALVISVESEANTARQWSELFEAIINDDPSASFWKGDSDFYERRFAELATYFQGRREFRLLVRDVLYCWVPLKTHPPLSGSFTRLSELRSSLDVLEVLLEDPASSAHNALIAQGIDVPLILSALCQWDRFFEPYSVRVLISRGQRLQEEIGKSPIVHSLHVLVGMTEWLEGFVGTKLLRDIGACPKRLREYGHKNLG